MQPQNTLSTFTTDALVCLAVSLDAVRIGLVTPGTSEYLELVDTSLLATVREGLRPTEDREVIEAIQDELEERHPQVAAAMGAWDLWSHRHTSWSTALLEAADAVREQEHGHFDRLHAVAAFTHFMNP